MSETESSATAERVVRSPAVALWKTWAFALVPLVGVVELGMHVWQTTGAIVPDGDWKAAREIVKGLAKPDDVVLFAPKWTDPLGREFFKDDVATLEREAFPDVTRFRRAVVVTIRGKDRAEVASWKEVARQKVGKITILTLENPAPSPVIDDLLAHAVPGRMSVQRLDGTRESDCPLQAAGARSGALGFGPGIPNERFVCAQGGFLGVSVLQPIDHSARKCFYAPPQGGGSVLRVRFEGVHFGKSLVGHHGIHWHQERGGSPVSLVWKAEGRELGKVVHNDGDAWKGFELDTRELEGKTGDLTAEIAAANAAARQYCFEATTR